MKLIPMLFSTPMVHAIMDGRKMQTRRLCAPHLQTYNEVWKHITTESFDFHVRDSVGQIVEPKWHTGDIIWVRESFNYDWKYITELSEKFYFYKADWDKKDVLVSGEKWKPSIHMPYDACRLWLKVKSIRVEKLQDIRDEDAIAEGIQPLLMSRVQVAQMGQMYRDYQTKPDGIFADGYFPYKSFQSLWQSINGEENWNSNPWVWRIEFERTEKPSIQK